MLYNTLADESNATSASGAQLTWGYATVTCHNSALLKSRFDQPGSAVMAMARMASPSRAAATRMNATASSVETKSR